MAAEVTRPLVVIREVSKSYRRGSQQVPVLQNLSLSIAEGQFLALMGPSGSGKSTLLNLIAGLDQVDSGSIEVDGVDIGALSESELARWRALNVGFIFQFYNLIPVLTALENVELPLLLSGLTRRQRRERAELALSLVRLADRLDHYPGQLSGGQQQRVAIARALINEPPLILADEPTGNLDSHTGAEILELLLGLNRERSLTLVIVTHDPAIAANAQRTIHLRDGLIVDD